MNKPIKNKPASIKAKLLNIARKENIDFDALLLRYLQERFIYRLAKSRFNDQFVLKGGLLLIYLNIPKSRSTKDIDFLIKKYKSDATGIKNIIKEIAEIDADDGVVFNVSSITSERIREDADYEGIRIKIEAKLGQAKKKLHIDLGFGDIIVPKPGIITLPNILSNDNPIKLQSYSSESIIAEKFEAMIKLAMANSRMKDFYDIYMLSSANNFNGKILKSAIEQTLKRRKTNTPDNPSIFKSEFKNDNSRKVQWNAFLRKSQLKDTTKDFSTVMKRIEALLKPVYISIQENTDFKKLWNSQPGNWI